MVRQAFLENVTSICLKGILQDLALDRWINAVDRQSDRQIDKCCRQTDRQKDRWIHAVDSQTDG